MDKRILKTFLLFIFLDLFPSVISGGWFCNNPSPPVCADDCDGNGYYISQDGTACIQCPQCSAGQELNKDCGNGLNGDAVCIPCPEGFFSLSTSQRCTQCTTCTNTVEQETCQLTQNRVCGDCLPGFVRGSDRFSTDFNACPSRCSDLPRDTPQCRDWWSNQEGELTEVDQPPDSAAVERHIEEVSLDDIDPCEPKTPLCIDPCHDGNFFLDYDGLCKACLSCQPGEELNKVCGRGKNGDAYCRRCPEGTFSEDGLQRCSPCRICVNTLATECTVSRNTECGECLPGYYQDADGYFPDQGACPNKCPECPNTVPQCQEWCETRTNPAKVIIVPTESVRQDDVTLSDVAVDIPQAGADDGINDEAKLPPASHGSYMSIFTVLASLLAVVIIVLIIVLFVFRYLWHRSNGSNGSEASLIQSRSGTPSPTHSPFRTPPVYERTTCPISPERDLEFVNHLRTAFPHLTSPRPVSGGSTDVEDGSSAVSTPTFNLNRRLNTANKNLLRQTLERQVGHDDSFRSTPPQPDSVKEERMFNSAGSMNPAGPFHGIETYPTQSDRDPRAIERLGYSEDSSWPRSSSSGKVVTERESGTVHPHVEDEDPRKLVRRRRSISQDEQLWPLLYTPQLPGKPRTRRHSLPNLLLVSSNSRDKKLRNGRNGNTAQVKEAEAELFPTDSSSDDGPTANDPVDTNNTNSAYPKQPRRPLEPIASPHTNPTTAVETKSTGYKGTMAVFPTATTETKPTGYKGTLAVLTEEIQVEKKPAAVLDDASSAGNKSPGDTNVTIHINMNTKDIERFQIGDVHNNRLCHDCAHRSNKASEPNNNDDNDEAQQLLHEGNKLTRGRSGNSDDDDDGDHDDAEEDKLLDHKSS